MTFVAAHESGPGALLPRAGAAACPELAKADAASRASVGQSTETCLDLAWLAERFDSEFRQRSQHL
jgi:hypothetical protein